MKKRQNSFMAIGIPSIFVIFAVLCLVILSLLTLETSRSDLRTSLLSMEQTSAYYDACGKAADICLLAEDYAVNTQKDTDNENDYFYRLASVTEVIPEVSFDRTSHILSFSVPVSEKQELYVELQAIWQTGRTDSPLEIATWKTQSTGTWTPDTRQPVFKGELP